MTSKSLLFSFPIFCLFTHTCFSQATDGNDINQLNKIPVRIDSVKTYEKGYRENKNVISDKEYFSYHTNIFGRDTIIRGWTMNNKYLKAVKAGDLIVFYYDIVPALDENTMNSGRKSKAKNTIQFNYDPNASFEKKPNKPKGHFDSFRLWIPGHARSPVFQYFTFYVNGDSTFAQIDSITKRCVYFSLITPVNGYPVKEERLIVNKRFFRKARPGDIFKVRYDIGNTNSFIIIPGEPLLNKHTIIDTSLAITTPVKRYSIDGDSRIDELRIKFTPKDSTILRIVKIPFVITGSNKGADLYKDSPELMQKRKLLVMYERNNPDKVYLVTKPPADTNTFHYRPHNNLVTINIIPTTMTLVGYERNFFHAFSLGIDWSYFWPDIGTAGGSNNVYGFHDNDGNGQHSDIPQSYYNIGQLNRFDLYFTLGDLRGFFVKIFYSYEIAKGLQQIYFNTPTQGFPDSSVTAWLAASPNNKVYYRKINFNASGWGLGIGGNFFLDRKNRLMAGIDVGMQLAYIPSSAKEPIFINGVEYYYQYTPAWEDTINFEEYGHITFSYRF
jgi:hypothetical protein